MHHEERMRRFILSSVASPAPQHSSTLSHNRGDHRGKKVTDHKVCVLILFTTFV